MRVSHGVSAEFDDPNLVSCAGLAPVLALAQRCGLHRLVAEHVTVARVGEGGANPHLKVPALVAGMVAGADSIDDMDLLRHGGMGRLFAGVRAPSTLGIFVRAFSFGHVRQLDAVAARFVANLAGHVPLLTGAGSEGGDRVVFVDIDDTVKPTYGYTKQGAGYGYSKVKGLNALIATASTPTSAPVIVGTRLRRGNVNSAKGADRLIADALKTTAALHRGAEPGPGPGVGLVLVRADSAYYNHKVIAAIRRGGAQFSITARLNKSVRAAIAGIAESAWTPIKYPHAIYDEAEQRWISDAEVAEIPYTAFTSKKTSKRVTARLIVRRVKRLNPTSTDGTQQGELLPAYRYHAVFTDSDLELVQAEAIHRGHAIIEQVIAELKDGPLAHLPSSRFNANGAWLVLAAIAFNLTRAAGALASVFHARARIATIRTHLIGVPGRIATTGRRIILHLPQDWPWEHAWLGLFELATTDPPPPLAA